MILNSVANGARKTGKFAVLLTGALLSAGNGCATHATQQMARTVAPEVLRVSHAGKNMTFAELSGYYSKDMLDLARKSKNPEEAGQILADGVGASTACNAGAEACEEITAEVCKGQEPKKSRSFLKRNSRNNVKRSSSRNYG